MKPHEFTSRNMQCIVHTCTCVTRPTRISCLKLLNSHRSSLRIYCYWGYLFSVCVFKGTACGLTSYLGNIIGMQLARMFDAQVTLYL